MAANDHGIKTTVELRLFLAENVGPEFEDVIAAAVGASGSLSHTWLDPTGRPATPPAELVVPELRHSATSVAARELDRATVRRWRRFGHDRLYVSFDGAQVGWWDLLSGVPHPHTPHPSGPLHRSCQLAVDRSSPPD